MTGTLTFYFLTAAIVCELTVSANLLTWIGDPYVSDGGPIAAKLHPGTYLIVAAFVTDAIGRTDPLQSLWSRAWIDRGAAVFIIGIIICIIFAFVLTGAGSVIVLVDTFLAAGVFALLATGLGPEQRRTMRVCIQACLAFNSMLALVETVLQSNLIPLYLNGAEYSSASLDFRPTALYDHPLTGATVTMIGILLPRASDPWARFRGPYLLLLCVSLLDFGGRTAFLLTCLALSGKLLRVASTSIIERNCTTASLHWAVIATALGIPAGLILTAAAGVGTRLIGHLYWDGSANVRVYQWQILNMLDGGQLLFGCRRDDLLGLLNPLRLSSGVEVIENFWLLEFISLGLIGFPFFVGALFSLLTFCAKRSGPGSLYLVTTFLIAATSSNSLGRKSNLLVVLVSAMSTAAGINSRRNVQRLQNP